MEKTTYTDRNRMPSWIPTASPWGAVDVATVCGEGIVFVSTASHGGFFLDAERLRLVPAFWRAAKDRAGYTSGGWFEEDCEAAMVVLAFQDVFTTDEVRVASIGLAYLCSPTSSYGLRPQVSDELGS